MDNPIVFIHGAFCGGWAFDAFRKPFERAGFVTHAPDLPGHEPDADLEDLAQIGIGDFADAIHHQVSQLSAPPILVGHSMGGLVAQVVAARAPCAGLILLAPSAPWGVPATTLNETGNSLGLSLLGDYWRRTCPPDYGTARRTTLDRLSRDDARRTFERFVPESGRAIMETIQWWMDHSMASSAPVNTIQAPVLALTGGQDLVNSSSTVRRIVERFPEGQAQFREFPEMSHWILGEPESAHVAKFAIEWLSERGLRARPRRKPRRIGQLNPAIA